MEHGVDTEPYLQIISAVLIIVIALWTLSRTAALAGHSHGDQDHPHDHGHDNAHAAAHTADIKRRFGTSGGTVTTMQIISFGLTGGLIPCPAAITVLLLCLQLKQLALGAMLVLCFSVGLALTTVSFGVAAAVGMQQAAGRWHGLTAIAARAPYLSSLLIIAIGVYTFYVGLNGLPARA